MSFAEEIQTLPSESEAGLQTLYPWLNENALATLPECVSYDVETRAVDQYLVNFCKLGIPGSYMDCLPVLYHTAPVNSALWHAVRTMAFARLKNAWNGQQGVPFSIAARRSYGYFLCAIRESIEHTESMMTNETLAALLLMDSFEVRLLRHARRYR
jgi:hypothetical protein